MPAVMLNNFQKYGISMFYFTIYGLLHPYIKKKNVVFSLSTIVNRFNETVILEEPLID